jgi:predicted PurR-regulated permease PerM
MTKNSFGSMSPEKRFRIMFLAIFFIVLIVTLYIFKFIFWPLLFAFVFFVALKPIHDFISKYISKKWIVTTIVILMFILLVFIPFLILLMSLADQAFEFYQFIARKFMRVNIDEYIYSDDRIRFILRSLKITRTDVIQKILELLQTTSFNFFSSITGMVKISISFVGNFMFMIVLLVAMFSDGKRFANAIYNVIPFPREIEKKIFTRIRDVIKVLVAGNILVMILQGLMLGLGFFIFGAGMPVLAGSIAAFFSLIPIVGTSVVWIPAVLFYVLSGKIMTAVLLGTWCLAVYLVIENFIKPKFFGDKLKFHPLVFFFLLIGSISVFNLPGIIVGPIILTIFFSLWEIYSLLYLEGMENISDVTESAIKKRLDRKK